MHACLLESNIFYTVKIAEWIGPNEQFYAKGNSTFGYEIQTVEKLNFLQDTIKFASNKL